MLHVLQFSALSLSVTPSHPPALFLSFLVTAAVCCHHSQSLLVSVHQTFPSCLSLCLCRDWFISNLWMIIFLHISSHNFVSFADYVKTKSFSGFQDLIKQLVFFFQLGLIISLCWALIHVVVLRHVLCLFLRMAPSQFACFGCLSFRRFF